MNKLALIIAIGTFTTLSACESMQPSKKESPNSTITQPSDSKPTIGNVDYTVVYNQSTGHLNADPDMSMRGKKGGIIADEKNYAYKLMQHTNGHKTTAIDFTQQKVIYQTLGWQNNGGHGIAIKDVTDNGSEVSVHLQHLLAGCITTMSFDYPALFAVVNTTKPIKIVMEEVGGCDMSEFLKRK